MVLMPTCFRCVPEPAAARETPYMWSSPRALCIAHKSEALLDDGERLSSVLAAIQPIEGGLLAFVFNPVRTGTHRGWTDFAAGGMAVYEDRFAARSYLEFRAFEVPWNVDLLFALHHYGMAHGDLPAPTSDKELLDFVLALVTQESKMLSSALRDSIPGRGLQQGLSDLSHAWRFEHNLRLLREQRRKRWPHSMDEAIEWVKGCSQRAPTFDTDALIALLPQLEALAARRFTALANATTPP